MDCIITKVCVQQKLCCRAHPPNKNPRQHTTPEGRRQRPKPTHKKKVACSCVRFLAVFGCVRVFVCSRVCVFACVRVRFLACMFRIIHAEKRSFLFHRFFFVSKKSVMNETESKYRRVHGCSVRRSARQRQKLVNGVTVSKVFVFFTPFHAFSSS